MATNRLTLVGLDIEGEWNVPLLRSAAAMSGADLTFACSGAGGTVAAGSGLPGVCLAPMDEVLTQFDHVIACEVTKRSQSVYETPAPRGHVGVLVGNELHGIPKRVLKTADQVVSIPMAGRGMSSVNVAVAAAIMLYALDRDLGRKRLRPSSLSRRDVDVLVVGPHDPSELGSLLRSAWAFGWQRVFLDDRHGVWFTTDRPTLLASRAAARREVNPLVVVPHEQLNLGEYRHVLICEGESRGTPLSRCSLATADKVLLVFSAGSGNGQSRLPADCTDAAERVFVDQRVPQATAAFRHAGSILLSVVSQLLRRGPRG